MPSRKQRIAARCEVLAAQGSTRLQIARVLAREERANMRVAMRWAHGWTQQQTADAWNVRFPAPRVMSAKTIATWEAWPSRSGSQPKLENLSRLASVYGCAVDDLLEPASGRTATQSTGRIDTTASVGRTRAESTPPQVEAGIGALLELVSQRIPLVGDQRSVQGITAFDEMTLGQSAEVLVKLFMHLDDQLGGDSLYPVLAHYVERLAVAVEHDPANTLLGFGQLSQFTGWLALDGNRHGPARRYFTSAVHVAHEADDPALAASALAYMSLQETYRGRPRSALSLAQTAVGTAAGRLTPLTATMLQTRLARALASLGQRDECLHSLEAARVAFQRTEAEDEPLWLSYVDEAELAAQEGACYLELGMTDEAVTSLQSAIVSLDVHSPRRTRDRAHYLVRLAQCSLQKREIEQACHIADEALGLTRTITSRRVNERLASFADSLRPFMEVGAVGDFHERLATAAMGVST